MEIDDALSGRSEMREIGKPAIGPRDYRRKSFGLSSEASAMTPMPFAVFPKSWRRVKINSRSRTGSLD